MSDTKYIGYCETGTLPIKRGDKVRIKKGTKIESMGSEGSRVAGTTRTIIVDHVLSGSTITLGSVYCYYGVDPKEAVKVYPEQRLKDVAGIAERLGMKNPWRDENATFAFLRQFCTYEKGSTSSEGEVRYTVRLHTHNPSVRWAGRGGYWQEVDINEVEKVES